MAKSSPFDKIGKKAKPDGQGGDKGFMKAFKNAKKKSKGKC